MSQAASTRPPRVLTGRAVLLYLIAFFGVIFAMNIVMVRVAVSSFSGVETESSYKAGLSFKNDVAAAHEQDARHWTVEASLERGETKSLVINARDAKDQSLSGLTAHAILAHPTDKRNDLTVSFVETSSGQFKSLTLLPEGHWDLVINLKREDDIVFRSKSRISL
jgi:nitrogen fixation protein FixH